MQRCRSKTDKFELILKVCQRMRLAAEIAKANFIGKRSMKAVSQKV